MKFFVVFLILLYVVTGGIGFKIYNEKVSGIDVANREIETMKSAQEKEVVLKRELEGKMIAARTNAAFLALALCPTLENTNTDALCIKNGTEWLSQTIIAGAALTDPKAKAGMEVLLTKLGEKSKPTAKQLYELLKPIEAASLKALEKNLN